MVTRRFAHKITTHRQGTVLRAQTPTLNVPLARPMREPRTNYLTYITAEGPRTIRF